MDNKKTSCCVPAASQDSVDVLVLPVVNSHRIKHHAPNLPTKQATRPVSSISLAGGWLWMGANDGPHAEDGEGPSRRVWVDPYSIAQTSVTNAEFSQFVEATGYKTYAETQGTSFVFHLFCQISPYLTTASPQTPWWRAVKHACWHAPSGPDSSITHLQDYPVTHIARADALAYCQWANCRLPTEAEWEYAARGGLHKQPFPWGDTLEMNEQHHANVWQGEFPSSNLASDGHVGTAPVKSYRPNNYGLYQAIGNVWEWTADKHTRLHNPRPSINPRGPLNGDHYVAKGGSYLCHESYCQRYRTSSRQALLSMTTADNIGFRVAGRHRVNTELS
ncbi:formylglycine-generating enzyme family protein [Granulosicoccus sp.]|nr:formylglycine-generating enzyme family protein [Granulosicoccus sp.]MDB4223859.1 formylglycine-generating enzyme family protein [Granulosicoccus sp.]